MKKIIDKIERTQYMEECPVCKKEIRGFSESQVIYNIKVHRGQKHPDDKKAEGGTQK